MQAAAAKGDVDTFIVRIYRRAFDPADELAGTVECIGSSERQPFVGRDELWDRLFRTGTHAHEGQPQDDARGREGPSKGAKR